MSANAHSSLLLLALTLGGCELIVHSPEDGSGSAAATGGSGSASSASGSSGSSAATGSTGGSTASSGTANAIGSTGIGASGSGTSATSGASSGSTVGGSGSASGSAAGGSTAGSSSGGSTGTVCAHGSTTGTGGPSTCATGLPPAPVTDWLLDPVPDSTPVCASVCTGNGEDGDWVYPRSELCPQFSAAFDDGVQPRSVSFSRDMATGITWQADAFLDGMTFDQALQTCSSGNWVFGTAARISLPRVADLVSLLDLGVDGGLPSGLDGQGQTFWARTDDADGGIAYWVNTTSGEVTPTNLLGVSFPSVRCVLGDFHATQMQVSCTINPVDGANDCELRDQFSGGSTGLRFHDRSPSVPLTWSAALAYCNTLAPCGTYRLPSYKELISLANFTSTPVGDAFIDALSGIYWSSTPAPGRPGSAMEVQFANASRAGQSPSTLGGPLTVSSAENVLCVRGP